MVQKMNCKQNRRRLDKLGKKMAWTTDYLQLQIKRGGRDFTRQELAAMLVLFRAKSRPVPPLMFQNAVVRALVERRFDLFSLLITEEPAYHVAKDGLQVAKLFSREY